MDVGKNMSDLFDSYSSRAVSIMMEEYHEEKEKEI